MSRSLEIIKRFVAAVRDRDTSVCQIRVSNSRPPTDSLRFGVSLSFKFKDGKLDTYLANTLRGAGLFSEDRVSAEYLSSGALRTQEGLEGLENKEILLMEVELTREGTPISASAMKRALHDETIYGIPIELYRNYPISQVEFFFGASQLPLELKKSAHSNAHAFQGLPLIVDFAGRAGFIEIYYVNEHGRLVALSAPITMYATAEVEQSLVRHNFKPRLSVRVFGGFIERLPAGEPVLSGWPYLIETINRRIVEELETHSRNQVRRISQRISAVNNRETLSIGSQKFGVKPVNEIETVLLFQKLASCQGLIFPGGLNVEILDYSPKDIDSICRFQMTPGHPEEIGPVEFEFELRSFFKHGHDHRQVKLIICFTAKPLTFPFDFGGVTYNLEESSTLPMLSNSQSRSSIPCLILENLFYGRKNQNH